MLMIAGALSLKPLPNSHYCHVILSASCFPLLGASLGQVQEQPPHLGCFLLTPAEHLARARDIKPSTPMPQHHQGSHNTPMTIVCSSAVFCLGC
jgi:hypothetical protein